MHDNSSPRKKALLVGIQVPKVTQVDHEASLHELERLVQTLGYDVIGSLSQKRGSTSGALVLGEGKLRELARWTGGSGVIQSAVELKVSKARAKFSSEADEEDSQEDSNASAPDDFDHDELEDEELETGESTAQQPTETPDVVVFDCDLSPSQLRNLESATGALVLDRTGVIIEIFSRHARTRAARLQVEIARLKYLVPRIRETGSSGDQEGGGGKGAGETSHELDRRRIRDRLKELRTELEGVQNEHAVRRTRRNEVNCVALVGYTNAGKSSLMRAMTGSEIYVADKLFATLDTTVRPVVPETTPRILLSDTVGFIKKLPHDLVASFRSTLDEALNANLLLYVVDAADPTFRAQLEVTRSVLHEIGATETPSRLILNKRDRLTAEQVEELKKEFPDAIMLSTRDPEDLKKLRVTLMEFFEGDMVEESIFVGYTVQGVIGEIRSSMRVLQEDFDGNGVTLKVRAKPDQLKRLKQKFGM